MAEGLSARQIANKRRKWARKLGFVLKQSVRMEKTDRNAYRLTPGFAVVAAFAIVGALVSDLGRGVSTSCVFLRRAPAGKAYDRKQFRKANDNHSTLPR